MGCQDSNSVVSHFQGKGLYGPVGLTSQVNRETFFQMNRNVYDTRGHCFKLATSRSRLEVRRNFFSQRVIPHWNRLPAHVVELEADTVNTFKNRLDKEWGN